MKIGVVLFCFFFSVTLARPSDVLYSFTQWANGICLNWRQTTIRKVISVASTLRYKIFISQDSFPWKKCSRFYNFHLNSSWFNISETFWLFQRSSSPFLENYESILSFANVSTRKLILNGCVFAFVCCRIWSHLINYRWKSVLRLICGGKFRLTFIDSALRYFFCRL